MDKRKKRSVGRATPADRVADALVWFGLIALAVGILPAAITWLLWLGLSYLGILLVLWAVERVWRLLGV